MEFSKEILASLKDGSLSDLRAELITCLDDEQRSKEEPKTLLLADAIAKEMQMALYEEDNGHFDFNQPLTSDSLRNAKSRLRINFSREKIAFACKVIAALNAAKPKSAVAAPAAEPEPAVPVSAELVPEAKVEPNEPKPQKVNQGATPPRSPKPNAQPPKGWTKPGSGGSGGSGAQAPQPPRRPASGKIPPRKVGFWERLFGTVGRRIDEFLQKIFG